MPFHAPAFLVEARRALQNGNYSIRTHEAYSSDWKMFQAWCTFMSYPALPAMPDIASLYVTYMIEDGFALSTVKRHLSAIRWHHVQAHLESPVTREVLAILSGAQRLLGQKPVQKIALTIAQIRRMMQKLPDTPKGLRDRAVVLFGFASALRRSTLCELDLADLAWCPDGITIHVHKEKQDQRQLGRIIGIPYGSHRVTCPVAAVKRWLEWRGKQAGALFTATHGKRGRLNPHRIAIIVKDAVARIGLQPDLYGGHSMRAGLVTEAIAKGVPLPVVAAQTGHRSLNTLQRYFRPVDLFRVNACQKLGL